MMGEHRNHEKSWNQRIWGKGNAGFTLAELLIVVAIIAVLVGVAIPLFSNQLEKSRESVDAANIRSQYAEVMAEAITNGTAVNVDGLEFSKIDLKQKESEWQNEELEKNLNSIASVNEGIPSVEGKPTANGKAWVSISAGVVTIHYEGGSSSGGSGSGNGASPMVSNALNATKGDSSSQILLSRLDDTLNDIISKYSTLDISSVSGNKKIGQDMVIYKVKVAADGSYSIEFPQNNTINLTSQPAANNKEASKLVGSMNDNPHDYYYVAVRKDVEGNPCATINLAVKDGKVVTKQVNWRNYKNMSYETSGLDNTELISLKK